jgi:hypothetical protein
MSIDPKHIITLSGRDYPLYSGILAEAHERGLQAIETELIQIPSGENDFTAIVKATVRMKDGSVFQDYGDSNPKNTNSRVALALIRMASTRSKGRALRDAINCGQTMLEELPDLVEEADSAIRTPRANGGAAPPPRHARPADAGHKGGQAAPAPEKPLTMPDGRTLTLRQILAGWERAERDALAAGIEPPDLDLLVCEPEDVYRAALELAHRVTEAKGGNKQAK